MIETLQIDQMLRAAVADGVAPALAFSVSRGERPPQLWFAGRHGPRPTDPVCGPETRFDLASLTKPLTTGLWIARLIDSGRLALDRPIGACVDVADPVLAATPLWRLMNHTAGLPAHRRYYEGLGAVRQNRRFDRTRAMLGRMLASTPCATEPGSAETYSDLGFMLLEWICANTEGVPMLERWADLPVHGADGLHLRPLARITGDDAAAYAATEQCPWRGRLMQGEVHDENGWIVGGGAGHAGTFGTLTAVHRAGQAWLNALRGRESDLGVSTAIVRAMTDRRWIHPRGTRVLAWDTPTPGRSSSGRSFGRHTIGHLGFTGTSIWIDPDEDVVMVLLTNRVCPSRKNERLRPFRPRIHDAGWAWIRSRFT